MMFMRFSAARRNLLAIAAVLVTAAPVHAADSPRVRFATTAGDFVIEVYPEQAPKTVENFLQYVKDKHYDGTIFHRVIDNARLDPVIIPPGDPVAKFEYQGQTYENVPRKNLVNHPQLFGYTVFGKIVSGMDTVEKIRNTPTGAGGPFPTDVPQKMVVIESARIQ